ncbi:hypothetical protein BAUCODRAFT_66010 [Baudoinia panamericana UAMH 10762]|uniref:Uncharacterized protein n=1 Tax=Baudoinia panamericana (strain UAMH 10762) TaxID=717646 RepID=M2LX50_BAUPA|nr:uncharacterized protein BAUCODRAFT_66010 [Baudoinia panamericana UAMH 10762]EMC99267.1 hypothetical protein BAUCODRAFT_66010 [Baudoinia panamericana UAMH 10762]
MCPRIYVYDKSEKSIGTSDFAAEFRTLLHPSLEYELFHRTNVGFEGESYLHHITSRWENLAHHTLFTQAHVHDQWQALRRVQDFLVPDTGFLSLAYPGKTCPRGRDCHDTGDWEESAAVLERVDSMTNASSVSENLVLTYRGQFIVSAARIHANDKNMYDSLRQWLLASEAGRKMAMSSTVTSENGREYPRSTAGFGYTLERMWGAIFDCSEFKVALHCPSLLSGMLGRRVSVDSCQCLDRT